MTRWLRHPSGWVFVILMATSGYYWQTRDWNSASRLMLTYALVDRGTVRIDGLEGQTRDLARYNGHWYTEKNPGYSLAAVPPYALARWLLGYPPHPLGSPALNAWSADYWATWATSGLATAWTGAMVASLALSLGAGPRAAGVLGLIYGLATPASVYATLAYGHQLAAFGLFGAFALLAQVDSDHPGRPAARPIRMALAGFLAAWASVVEIQSGPVSALLGLGLLAQVAARRRPVGAVLGFALGASVPTLVLLGYNWVAFDDPRRMGYFYLVMDRFKEVHSAANPLGLRVPDPAVVGELLVGIRRGLAWFAPVVVLTPWGLALLTFRGRGPLAAWIGLILGAVFLVNLSYPEWTGGWTTGPRLLLPLLPFAVVAVAPVLASGGRWAAWAVAALGFAGAVEMALFIGVGGRVPDGATQPLGAVLPSWLGGPVPGFLFGERFSRNLVGWTIPGVERTLGPTWAWLMFAPLWLGQVAATALMLRVLPRTAPSSPSAGGGDEARQATLDARPDPLRG